MTAKKGKKKRGEHTDAPPAADELRADEAPAADELPPEPVASGLPSDGQLVAYLEARGWRHRGARRGVATFDVRADRAVGDYSTEAKARAAHAELTRERLARAAEDTGKPPPAPPSLGGARPLPTLIRLPLEGPGWMPAALAIVAEVTGQRVEDVLDDVLATRAPEPELAPEPEPEPAPEPEPEPEPAPES